MDVKPPAVENTELGPVPSPWRDLCRLGAIIARPKVLTGKAFAIEGDYSYIYI